MKTIRIECEGASYLELDELTPFQGDLKDLPDENYLKLREEIERDGFSAPFFIWRRSGTDLKEKYILDGHQREKALQRMREREGYHIPPLPVVWVDAMDEPTAKRKVLALTSQFGQMNAKSLANFITESKLEFTDVATSFRFPEVKFEDVRLILNPDKEDEDQGGGAGDGSGPLRTQLGDLWKMGEHRLLVGDSLALESWDRLMQEDRADCVWTDPPYNVDYEGTAGKIQNDSMSDEKFFEFLRTAFSNCVTFSKEGAGFYIAHADSEGLNFRRAVKESGWDLKQCLIWVKSSLVMGRQDYQWRHEPILYGWKPGAAHSWYGERDKTTVLEFDKPKKNDIHPTMKPVELIEHCLLNSSTIGDVVVDPFAGSGSTIMACDKLKRCARAIELDPKFASAILTRWEAASGLKAELI